MGGLQVYFWQQARVMDRTFSSNRRPAGFRSVRVEGDAELLASANSGLFLPRAQEPEQHE